MNMRFTRVPLLFTILLGGLAACDSQPPTESLTPSELAEHRGGLPDGAGRPAIVLVHGAWGDGSHWQEVVPILQRRGYRVAVAQNALNSLEDDVATTRRLIDEQEGPVVAVGHSYGGAVVTMAAAGAENVEALVYIAAFVPEEGEVLGELNVRFGESALLPALHPDAAGFLYIEPEKFREVFAQDVPSRLTNVLAVSQNPISFTVFSATGTAAAWKTIPSWYLLAKNDRTIKPELQQFMSARAGARVTEIRSSHLVPVSNPRAVADLIEKAARGVR
jgi:pimeloyl-ACP methyl ester carboxylesterase